MTIRDSGTVGTPPTLAQDIPVVCSPERTAAGERVPDEQGRLFCAGADENFADALVFEREGHAAIG